MRARPLGPLTLAGSVKCTQISPTAAAFACKHVDGEGKRSDGWLYPNGGTQDPIFARSTALWLLTPFAELLPAEMTLCLPVCAARGTAVISFPQRPQSRYQIAFVLPSGTTLSALSSVAQPVPRAL